MKKIIMAVLIFGFFVGQVFGGISLLGRGSLSKYIKYPDPQDFLAEDGAVMVTGTVNNVGQWVIKNITTRVDIDNYTYQVWIRQDGVLTKVGG